MYRNRIFSVFAFCTIMALVIVFDKKPNTLNLDKAWKKTVGDDSDAACKIEEHLQCSGYSSCCGSSSSDPSFMLIVASPPTRLMAPTKSMEFAKTANMTVNNEVRDLFLAAQSSCTASSDDCPSDCSHNSYTTSCESALIDYVHKYFWAFIGVDAGIIMFCFLVAAMAASLSPGDQGQTDGAAPEQQHQEEKDQEQQDQNALLSDGLILHHHYYNCPQYGDGLGYDELHFR